MKFLKKIYKEINMNKVATAGIAVMILIAGGVPGAAGQEEEDETLELSGGVEAGMYSEYVWRGMKLNSEPVFQPEIWVDFWGFSAGIWGNIDETGFNGKKGELTEVDYSVSYTHEFDFISASLVYLYYDYPAYRHGD